MRWVKQQTIAPFKVVKDFQVIYFHINGLMFFFEGDCLKTPSLSQSYGGFGRSEIEAKRVAMGFRGGLGRFIEDDI